MVIRKEALQEAGRRKERKGETETKKGIETGTESEARRGTEERGTGVIGKDIETGIVNVIIEIVIMIVIVVKEGRGPGTGMKMIITGVGTTTGQRSRLLLQILFD